MSDAINLARLIHTPVQDLVRGRITGRYNWRRRIASAELPAAAIELILRVVKQTKLWRSERVAVADELIAHFADGIEADTDVGEIIRDFGEERAAAKLIRRAKKRNRPLAWHALNWFGRGVLVLIAIYAVLIVRFVVGKPTIKVDYVAVMNEPIVRVPASDRAWPLYRKAIFALDLDPAHTSEPINQRSTDSQSNEVTIRPLADALPGDPRWSELGSWLEAHQAGFDLLRQAAAKPALGFELGKGGPAYDDEIGFPRDQIEAPSLANDSVIGVILPHLSIARNFGNRLSSDLRYSRSIGDGERVVDDLVAMHGLARQLRQSDGILVTALVSMGIDGLAFRDLDETLTTKPEIFTDEQLIRLAHTLAAIGGETASAFFNLRAERATAQDVMQRIFTDDGHGDGRLTLRGLQDLASLSSLGANTGAVTPIQSDAATALAGGAVSAVATRRGVAEEYERLFNQIDAEFAVPLYQLKDKRGASDRRIQEIIDSPLLLARLFPVTVLMPSTERIQRNAEIAIGKRDGALVGIALEAFRRKHDGHYPTTLDELVPLYLPRVPTDRISGEPVKYRIIDGKPIVYSVGFDRDDDGGKMPVDAKNGQSHNEWAAEWTRFSQPVETGSRFDGDWILFGSEVEKNQP